MTIPKSSGKSHFKGRIRTRESDAWIIYYRTPVETPINIRYDLKVMDYVENEIVFKYNYNKHKTLHEVTENVNRKM